MRPRNRGLNGKLQPLSLRLPGQVFSAIRENQQQNETTSGAARRLIVQALARDQILLELVSQALADQRVYFGTVLRVVLMNVCSDQTEAEVSQALQHMEEQGLL